jgi:hypothetical protein
MAEALVSHPDTRPVSRNVLHADMQTLRTEVDKLRADLNGALWRVFLTAFAIQVVLVGLLVTILVETLARSAT